MGRQRWAIFVGILATSACKPSERSDPPAASTATPAGPRKAAISAPAQPALAPSHDSEAPSLPAPPSEGAPPPGPPPPPRLDPPQADPRVTPAQAFERQTRDPSWAGPTEAEIKKRVTKLGTRVDSTECRHDSCAISFRGSEEEVGRLLATLETPDGLQGFATQVYLTAPVDQGGTLVLRAYATFER